MDVTRVSSGLLLPAAPAASRPERAERGGQSPPAEAAQRAAEPQAPELAAATLEEVAKRLESWLRSVGRRLEFRVDPQTDRIVISVRDAATGELIRQIPSEEALELARMIADETAARAREKFAALEE
ncbi:MAG TPA: flagellar protein FlaG [Gammaproteobacteria bacterium]